MNYHTKAAMFFSLLLVSFAGASENLPIMTYQKYVTVAPPFPYSYTLIRPNQALFYFGANHSCDPSDQQYPMLRTLWDRFLKQTKGKNCVVLVEGCTRRLCHNEHDAITKAGGEGGLVTFLAHQEGISVECPELDERDAIHELKKHFPEEQVAYRYFAINVLQYNRYKKVEPTLVFDEYITRCLRNTPIELKAMKQLHQTLFNQPFNPDDEQFFNRIINPTIEDTVINNVCRTASMQRDRAIVNRIDSLIKQGKSVFVVFGGTHAVMQEPAIRTSWLRNQK